MPAIAVGLGEIEGRVRALRRRLNLVTLQHGVYLGGSAVVLLAAALVLLGVRGSAPTFRIAVWGAAGMTVTIAGTCALFLRRRWRDEQDTARFVDRRAQLTDRLTTIVALRLRPGPSRLLPVLIAQTLALGSRWQPPQIVPRRIPRSIFVLLTSLLALVATVLIARQAPRATSPDVGTKATEAARASAIREAPLPGAGHTAAGEPSGSVSSAPPSTDSARGAQPSGTGTSEANISPDLSNRPQTGTPLTSLPDRLQEAIRHAVHGESAGKPIELAARSEGHADSGEDSRERSHGPDDKGTLGRAGQPPSGGHGDQQSRPGQSGSSQRQAEPAPANQPLDGHAPGAGDGSSPNSLLDANAADAGHGAGPPKTFKLTITSFLRAVTQQTNPQQKPGKPAALAIKTGGGGSAESALSDRQLSDDVVRKAEVPPEYEDIVRRVYSARAGR